MFNNVVFATIALLTAISRPSLEYPTVKPASFIGSMTMTRVDTPNQVYYVYLLINGQYQNVTAQSAYNENHVFYQSQYVGDRTGANNLTIVNTAGQVIGYMEPINAE